jgi:hypothetical protein
MKGQSLDRTDNIYNTISVLYSLKLEEVEGYSIEQIEKLFANIPDFTNYVPEMVLDFELYGVKYFVCQDAKDLNFRQYIDLDFYENKYKDNPLEMATYLLAVISTKAGEKYDSSDISTQRGELFKELPVVTVLGVFNYFIKKKENYSKVMELYFLVAETHSQQVQSIESLVKNGVGTSRLTRWLKARFWNKIKSSLSIS